MEKRTPLKNRFREGLVSALEVPTDLAWKDSLVTLTGSHQAVVENFRKLVKCSDCEMIVRCRDGIMIIRGKRLKIDRFLPEEILISGAITGIQIER